MNEDLVFSAPSLEQEILGAIARSNLFYSVGLCEDDFSSTANQTIFKAIARRAAEGKDLNDLLVIEDMRVNEELERGGGVSYIMQVLQGGAGSESLQDIADILKSYSTRRKLRDVEMILHNRLHSTDFTEDILADIQTDIASIMQGSSHQRKSMGDMLLDYRSYKESIYNGSICKLSTGFESLDKMLDGGFENGQFVVIAARSSMGKTALSLRIAANMAKQGKHPLFLTMESTGNKLIDRLVSSETGISVSELQDKNGLSKHWSELDEALRTLEKATLTLDVRDKARVSDIAARARQLQSQGHLDAVFVDYLQLIKPRTGERAGTPREQIIASIADDLLAMAHSLNVPVIALAQTNRATETRQDKRPMLSDIRESDRIAQNADIVLSLHREEYYKKDETPLHKRGVTDILVLKNRDGKVGTAYLNFNPETVDFYELTPTQKMKVSAEALNRKESALADSMAKG